MNAADPSAERRRGVVLAVAIVLVGLALLVHADKWRFADPDFFVNLYTGREIVELGYVPTSDTVTFTIEGQPWDDYEWLARLGFFRIFDALGGPGLVLARLLILGAMILLFCVHAIERRVGFGAFAGWALLFGLAAQRYLLFRATLVTFLLVAVVMFLFYRARRGRPWLVWIVPLLIVPWVNLHAGFALGVVLFGMLVVESLLVGFARRRPATVEHLPFGLGRRLREAPAVPVVHAVGAFATTLLLSGIHPIGYRIWLAIFGTLGGGITPYITEWKPLYSFGAELWFVWVLLDVVAAVLWLARRELAPLDLMVTLSLGLASVLRVRFVPLFAITGTFVVLALLPAVQARWRERLASILPQGLRQRSAELALFTALAAFVAVVALEGRRDLQLYKVEAITPVRAVRFLQVNDIGGRILNELDWGGYVRFKLPDSRIFVDSRSDTVYPEWLVGEWARFVNAADDWREIADKYDVQVVCIREWHPVAERLEEDPGWIHAYTDPWSTIYLRDSEANADTIERLRAGELILPEITPADYVVR
jgi:hypothetical protein